MYSQRNKSKVEVIYFDNASSSRRSKYFVDKLSTIWGTERTKEEELDLIVRAEERIKKLLNTSNYYISFVPNATYGLNEIAYSLTPNKSSINPKNIKKDIYLSDSEHASNHLIWLKLSSKPITYLSLKDFNNWQLPNKSSIFSFVCSSNLEGISIDLKDIENKFRGSNHVCIVDATQLLQYELPNLNNSSIDFLVFTAHKCFGPNGIGVVCSKNKEDTIGINRFNYSYKQDNYRLNLDSLEAWIDTIDNLEEFYKNSLFKESREKLNSYFVSNFPYSNPYIELVNKETKGFIFVLRVTSKDISAHDYAFYLNREGVIVRTGIVCSWLSGERYDPEKIIRVSLGPFNKIEEISYLFALINNFSLEKCL